MHSPSVLVVCMGNICRSPIAEGVLRAHAARLGMPLEIDSAGTHAYHVGASPDPRARAVCRAHAINIDHLRARQVERLDFERFDWVLAADRENLVHLNRRFAAPSNLALLLDFAGIDDCLEVPDPYYGSEDDFVAVYALLDRAAGGVLRRLASPA